MNAIILTTQTLHHTYYVKSLLKTSKVNFTVVVEKKKKKPPFKIRHYIDSYMSNFEEKKWFKNSDKKIKDYCKPIFTDNINKDKKLIKKLKDLKPKFLLIFGTGILSKNFIKNFNNIYNFHGGDLENYRGLDSHFWSMYHGEFKKLYIYLHEAKPRVDTGRYLYKKLINIKKNTNIASIRYLNTLICVFLTKKFIDDFKKKKNYKKKIKFNWKILFSYAKRPKASSY